MSLVSTLGNSAWLRDNETNLREMLPDTWTLMTNLNGVQIGFRLKLIGVDWRNEDEFSRVMIFLEKVGIMQRKDYLVRRNPDAVLFE